MPKLSVWAIRASLVYLLSGFTIGAGLLSNKGMTISPQMWLLLPAHIEFLLMGWMVQIAIGVAYWILPRHAAIPKRGNPALAWMSVLLLNIGILLAAASPFIRQPASFLVLGRALELAGIGAFILNAWPRIRQFAG